MPTFAAEYFVLPLPTMATTRPQVQKSVKQKGRRRYSVSNITLFTILTLIIPQFKQAHRLVMVHFALTMLGLATGAGSGGAAWGFQALFRAPQPAFAFFWCSSNCRRPLASAQASCAKGVSALESGQEHWRKWRGRVGKALDCGCLSSGAVPFQGNCDMIRLQT
jgi:hypothetical protein